MDLFHRYGNLLKSDGTNQLQRTLPALENDYIRPDERSPSHLVAYARGVARELRFHALAGQAVGDWSPMFDELLAEDGTVLGPRALQALKAGSNAWSPQLALFLAFLEVFQHLQADLNGLPARHLAYYYDQFLQVVRRTAQPDRVHVVFELARNSQPHRLRAGTRLDAGRDAQGRSLAYVLEREVIVTHARISSVLRLVAERDRFGRRRFFKADRLPDEGSWPTFGSGQFGPRPEPGSMEEVDQGFAIGSPLFRLSEGVRRITIAAQLTATGAAPPPQDLSLYVRVEVTGEAGWFEPRATSVALVEVLGRLEIHLSADIAEDQPAVVDFDGKLHQGLSAPAAPWPLLRCLVRSDSGHFDTLDGLAVAAADISVAASGLRDLVVQNDQGGLVPSKPIELFGTRPSIGANFYIGSHEVFSKRLTGLTLHLEWQDLPPDLLDHYRQYFDVTDSVLASLFQPSFDVLVDLLDGRSWDHRLAAPQRLFDVGSDRRSLSFGAAAFASSFPSGDYAADPDMSRVRAYSASTRRGFLRLRLNGPTSEDLSNFGVPYAWKVPFTAFGHDAFAPRYAQLALELARWDSSGTEPQPVLPNEPYTPTLAGLTLDYKASTWFAVADVQAHERFYTIGPFGHTTASAQIPARLVPGFEGRAALVLGVERFSAPANLSVLFQLDEGTASAAELLQPSDLAWSYLSGDRWIKLPSTAVLSDETRGFQTSGVISVAVGRDATNTHTAMPSGLTWLQAQIAKSPQSAARTLALHAQAATARFSPESGKLEDYEEHLAEGLGAKTISKLKHREAAVKKVEQPYASFGGQPSEPDRHFFQRTSERLRHRKRAVTVWDFERLVLDRFDAVFKVKCLAHSNARAEQQVGDAALVILPNLLNSRASNRLEPRAGEVLMEEIRRFIAADVATPFARVHVIHPVYERVLVEARVAFREGYDPGFYAEQLNLDLQRFLSPWAFEEGRDIVFGARIYRSELLKFMEEREYVDYITAFNLYHSFAGSARYGIGFMEIGADFVIGADPRPAIGEMVLGTDFVVGRGVESAATTQPHAVLVSHYDHRIEPIIPGAEHCTGVSQLGIGYMTVDLDFEVMSR
jgi:hypothetical protein